VKLLRHLSALLSAGLIWGVLWVALGILAGTIIGIVDPHEIDPGEKPVVLAPMIGLVGFICGVAFGALLSTAKKGEPFYSLPSSRAAMGGILVAAALPIVAGKRRSRDAGHRPPRGCVCHGVGCDPEEMACSAATR